MFHQALDPTKLQLLQARGTKGPLVIQRASSRSHALELLQSIASQHTRLGITGGPGVGKTTLATLLGLETGAQLLCTDAYKNEPWDKQKELAYQEFLREPGRAIMEGVTVARVARMSPPAFSCVVWLKGRDRVASSTGRKGLHKTMEKWVSDIELPVYQIELNY